MLDWSYWPENAWGSHEFDKARFPDPKGNGRFYSCSECQDDDFRLAEILYDWNIIKSLMKRLDVSAGR